MEMTSLFGDWQPRLLTPEEEYAIWWQWHKNEVLYSVLDSVPQWQPCGWCGEKFLAKPDHDGGHEPYCSPECEEIQAGIDAYENHLLDTHERMFLARFEHPSEL